MPTRIQRQHVGPTTTNAATAAGTSPSSRGLHRLGADPAAAATTSTLSPPASPFSEGNYTVRQSNRKSSLPLRGFRSSILRELSVRSHTDDDDNAQVTTAAAAAAEYAVASDHQQYNNRSDSLRLSKNDIRASPRLLGYLFSMIAGSVMLVSVVQFYRNNVFSSSNGQVVKGVDSAKYYLATTGLVYHWKLWGAIYIGSIGVGMNLATLLVHFDTILAPKLWVAIFRDGSLWELCWIVFMTLFWAAGVHVCTSSLSVGESQANTFFTSWIAFGSVALNLGVWCESSGLPSLGDRVNMHARETTYNWMWTGVFSTIFAGAATDVYVNRNELELRVQGEELNLDNSKWTAILGVIWAEVVVCAAAIALNEISDQPFRLPFSFRHTGGRYRCVFGWRQLEGLIVLVAMGGKFWVILEYTGVNGTVNGLSNAYFGVWGSFFNSVFTLGTWLKENKNIEYFVREQSEDAGAEEGDE